jgi:hypothetical protein
VFFGKRLNREGGERLVLVVIEEELEKLAEKRVECLVFGSEDNKVRPASNKKVSDLRAEGDVVFDELFAGDQQPTHGNDFRRWKLQALKAVAIGPESVGENEGIAAVVLGPAHRMSVAETVGLLGVDGKNGDTAFEKCFDYSPVRFFNGHSKSIDFLICHFQEPIHRFRQSLGTMSKASFSDKLCVGIDDACLVKPLAEIDADEKTVAPLAHNRLQTASRM